MFKKWAPFSSRGIQTGRLDTGPVDSRCTAGSASLHDDLNFLTGGSITFAFRKSYGIAIGW